MTWLHETCGASPLPTMNKTGADRHQNYRWIKVKMVVSIEIRLKEQSSTQALFTTV